jgi:hypothetical protein
MSDLKPTLRISRITRYATPGVRPAPSGGNAAFSCAGDELVGRPAALEPRHGDSDIRVLLGQCCEARMGIGILTGS